jgi:glyoxylase-like metal-dependent hydrolase (beta-lactamase superfamily II)
MKMYFKQIHIGGYDKNLNYFVGANKNEVLVVDPVNIDELLAIADSEGIGKIVGILITHTHHDHIAGTPELFDRLGPIPIFVHENGLNKFSTIPSDWIKIVRDNSLINFAGISAQVIWTPGHINDAVCYLLEDRLITGDTLFVGGCGRCDLAGSDVEAQYDSLHNKIASLSRKLTFYPGHDYGETPFSTLEQEFATNPYLLATDKQDFIDLRMRK